MTITANEKDHTLTLQPKDARLTSDALADVILWFRGYRSAKGEHTEDMPPPESIARLAELNRIIKELPWSEEDPEAIPF